MLVEVCFACSNCRGVLQFVIECCVCGEYYAVLCFCICTINVYVGLEGVCRDEIFVLHFVLCTISDVCCIMCCGC